MKAKIFILCFCIYSLLFTSPAYCNNYNIRKKPNGTVLLHIHGQRSGLGRFKGIFKYTTKTTLPVKFVSDKGINSKNISFSFLDGFIYAPRFYGKSKQRIYGITHSESNNNIFIPLDRTSGFKRSLNISSAAGSNKFLRVSHIKPKSEFRCSSKNNIKTSSPLSRHLYNRSGGSKSITLAVDIDSRFSKLHGRKALLAAVLALQKTSNVYSSTFGYAINISAITQFTSSTSDPVAFKYKTSGQLLQTYRQYRINNPITDTDIYHLMTSQRGFLDAIGLAYIGSMCALPEYAAGWSDYSSGFLIFAQTLMHEIGHNVNASHDSTDLGSLMSVSNTINIVNPYFSSFSISEVSSFISNYNSCFDISTGNQIPTPSSSSYRHPNEKASSIKLSASVVKCGTKRCLKGKIANLKNIALSGRVVELLSFPPVKLLRTTFTDSKGKFNFILTKRGRYYLSDRLSQKTTNLFRY